MNKKKKSPKVAVTFFVNKYHVSHYYPQSIYSSTKYFILYFILDFFVQSQNWIVYIHTGFNICLNIIQLFCIESSELYPSSKYSSLYFILSSSFFPLDMIFSKVISKYSIVLTYNQIWLCTAQQLNLFSNE